MTEPLLSHSKLKNILEENPSLAKRSLREGELIAYKGRKYGWIALNKSEVYLSDDLMKMLEIKVGDKLLAIRSSDIAFTMGFRGSLIDKANNFKEKIETFWCEYVVLTIFEKDDKILLYSWKGIVMRIHLRNHPKNKLNSVQMKPMKHCTEYSK